MLCRRAVIALIAISTSALGQPILTTVQDTLYKADGTRFNGLRWATGGVAPLSPVNSASTSPIVPERLTGSGNGR